MVWYWCPLWKIRILWICN